ncbi:MAG: hypothetical protein NUV65_06480 [Candidatus Roizmanbacteria bacterium]|nr:hypothetical protein [Candidatus Roizmanbacteria bacterium]
MKRVFGWFLFFLGIFFLGLFARSFLSDRTQSVSPVPNNEKVRVLMLSPGAAK